MIQDERSAFTVPHVHLNTSTKALVRGIILLGPCLVGEAPLQEAPRVLSLLGKQLPKTTSHKCTVHTCFPTFIHMCINMYVPIKGQELVSSGQGSTTYLAHIQSWFDSKMVP